MCLRNELNFCFWYFAVSQLSEPDPDLAQALAVKSDLVEYAETSNSESGFFASSMCSEIWVTFPVVGFYSNYYFFKKLCRSENIR